MSSPCQIAVWKSATADQEIWFRLHGAVAGVDPLIPEFARLGVNLGCGWGRLTMDVRVCEIEGYADHAGVYGVFTSRPAVTEKVRGA